MKTETGPRRLRGPLMLFAAMAMAACSAAAPVPNRTPEVTATEAALCRAWGQSLPSRSRSDTPQTQSEIGRAYDVQAAACPNHPRIDG